MMVFSVLLKLKIAESEDNEWNVKCAEMNCLKCSVS